jgi:crotonobetainyl-CoA:carnitine CoA-transferase CaiB-like acyl-CoA transferase
VAGPLDGVRILDLTRLLPGDYCTLLLADLGADVVKIEEPGQGDYIRWIPPLIEGEGATHRALNRGKRSVTVNLKQPDGVAVLRRLAKDADALVESFRPGVMDRLGVGYEVMSKENPRLVYCAITGFGQAGPYQQRAGHDINYIGYAGVLDTTGPPDGPPILPSVQVGDFGSGMAAAVGLLGGLVGVGSTGRGRFIDISMLDVAFSWLAVNLTSHLAGVPVVRGGMLLTGGYACYRVYRTSDDRYLSVGAIEPHFWRALCEGMGAPDLSFRQYDPDQREVAARLEEIFLTRTRDEWVKELADLEACVGPVNEVSEALVDPQLLLRGMVAEIGGAPVGPGPVVKVSDADAKPLLSAPTLGEHTEEILEEAGFSSQDIEGFRQRGVV